MGQKLVTIKFNAGSSSNLWNPELRPDFKVQVSPDGSDWSTEITQYYPDLARMTRLPVNLGSPQPLSNSFLQSMIRNNQSVAFLVDDSISQWRIQFSDGFLTGDEPEILTSGSFN